MESPGTERQSVDATGTSRRGPNPNRDYKQHFNRQKERYDTVTGDQTSRKRELYRASSKQIKLQEEIEYLLDAIAEQRSRRGLGEGATTKGSERVTPASTRVLQSTTRENTKEQEDIKPAVTRMTVEEAEDVLVDTIEAEMAMPKAADQAQELEEDNSSRRRSARHSRTSQPTSIAQTIAPSSAKSKRRRPSYSDTDEELLEAAGVGSKRSRND